MKYHYEVVKYDENLPGKILMQHKPGYRCNTFLHWHKELEFVYMIDGELDAKIGGKEVRINSGDFYFCNSEEIHITSAPDEKKTVKYVVVLLSYDYLRSFHKAIDRYQFKITEAHKAVIADLLRRIVSIKESDEQYMDISLNIMLLELYRYLLENCTAEKESMLPTNVPENFIYAKQAIEYVEKNYKNDISMKSVADLVGLSPTYFSKYFKNVADVSFIRYLNLVRLEHALNDMFYDNQNVTNAAMNNGFANVKSFIELCKKIYGYTPTEYRKRILSNE